MEESRKRLGAGAASPSKFVYAEKPAPVTLTLRVKNIQSATTEVMRLAEQLGGTGTTAESTRWGAFLSTTLPARNFTIFVERIARLGTLDEKSIQTKHPPEDISLHIRISGDL
ncbi:MAG: hypothetical protein A4E65_02736 [Syntrophorhabdus sp. PtaU1.Bin153]|nr:MAG: hypothetical protein A4E65_02736 [Syntrophorhabdus sp. PtaU1.Bin153]